MGLSVVISIVTLIISLVAKSHDPLSRVYVAGLTGLQGCKGSVGLGFWRTSTEVVYGYRGIFIVARWSPPGEGRRIEDSGRSGV